MTGMELCDLALHHRIVSMGATSEPRLFTEEEHTRVGSGWCRTRHTFNLFRMDSSQPTEP